METFFALGIARTHVLSYTVPIVVVLEISLDPSDDFSYVEEGAERMLIHRWRAGGVVSVLEEGVPYVVGIEVMRRDVIPDPALDARRLEGTRGERIQAIQAFVIPQGSGIAPLTRNELRDRVMI
jgi:hypothetical protein